MATYKPDGWTIIEFQEDHYVFASWSGGYLDGDSWKRNSGITRIVETPEAYEVHGYSGSVYQLSRHGQDRISGYNQGVLRSIITSSPGAKQVDMADILEKYLDKTDA